MAGKVRTVRTRRVPATVLSMEFWDRLQEEGGCATSRFAFICFSLGAPPPPPPLQRGSRESGVALVLLLTGRAALPVRDCDTNGVHQKVHGGRV